MGGVAYELERLSRSRPRSGEAGNEPDPGDDTYRAVMRALRSRLAVDVVSGTSAGGINAAALALSKARGGSMACLRETWIELAWLDHLIRSPQDKQPPSLMYGDDVLLAGLQQALSQVAQRAAGVEPDPSEMSLMLTTTLMEGRIGNFRDDYGTLVHD